MSITINEAKKAQIDTERFSPPVPAMFAAAFNLTVGNGEVTGIEAGAGLAAAMYLDVGTYLLFFLVEQPDTNYFPEANDENAFVQVTEKGVDYIIVSATDGNGNPVDPARFNVKLYRIG